MSTQYVTCYLHWNIEQGGDEAMAFILLVDTALCVPMLFVFLLYALREFFYFVFKSQLQRQRGMQPQPIPMSLRTQNN